MRNKYFVSRVGKNHPLLKECDSKEEAIRAIREDSETRKESKSEFMYTIKEYRLMSLESFQDEIVIHEDMYNGYGKINLKNVPNVMGLGKEDIKLLNKLEKHLKQ